MCNLREQAPKAWSFGTADRVRGRSKLAWRARRPPLAASRSDEAGSRCRSTCHRLFGAACALAALPGRLRSPRPLRLVLDRRPFI